jgi:hypothetical protein
MGFAFSHEKNIGSFIQKASRGDVLSAFLKTLVRFLALSGFGNQED